MSRKLSGLSRLCPRIGQRRSFGTHASPFVNLSRAPRLDPSTLIFREDVISERQEKQLMGELDPYMRRRGYERGHWDSVISGYKEREIHEWNDADNAATIAMVKDVINREMNQNMTYLAHTHALDLARAGEIRAHVDNVEASGRIVAGLSLLSPAILKLTRDDEEATVMLPPRSLYIMADSCRYDYAHAILAGDVTYHAAQSYDGPVSNVAEIASGEPGSLLDGRDHFPVLVKRERRISIMLRDENPSRIGKDDDVNMQLNAMLVHN